MVQEDVIICAHLDGFGGPEIPKCQEQLERFLKGATPNPQKTEQRPANIPQGS